MTTPPPPPGSGGDQPHDPTRPGSGTPPEPPAPSGTAGPTGSSGYGGSTPSGPTGGPGGPGGYGQAPPPSGGPGQGPSSGSDKTKTLSFVSMGTGIVGLVLCCCWGLPIFSLVAVITGLMANKDIKANNRTDVKKFAMIGLITGAIGLLISIVYWILVATGAIDINTTWDTSNL